MKFFREVTVAWLLVVLVMPSVSFGQSISNVQMQARLQQLLGELQSLEQQYALTQGSQPLSSTLPGRCYSFESNLAIGSTGTDVQALQQVLSRDGDSVAMSGVFNEETASAVTGFQEKYAVQILAPNGLQHGTGFVGSSTRATLNDLFGCQDSYQNIVLWPPNASSSPLGQVGPAIQGTLTLSVVVNPVFNSGMISPEMASQRIGSYVLTNSSLQNVAVNSVLIGSGSNGSLFRNLKILIGNTQFGVSQQTVQSGAYYTFSAGPTVPGITPGGALTLDVYGDTITTDSTGSSDTTLFGGCSAADWSGNGTYNCTSATGQTMTIAAQSLLPIKISHPQAGAQWASGETVPIQWAAAIPWNASGNETSLNQGLFAITLLATGSNAPIFIANGPASSFLASEGDVYSQFTYNYAVPTNAIPGQYSLTVTQYLNNAQTSRTQQVTITRSLPGITIIAPAGDEHLFQAQQFTIRWSALPSARTIGLNLLQNGNLLYPIVNAAPNTGSYVWTIPQDNNAGMGFQIQITGIGVSGTTSNSFSISKTRG